MSKSKWRFRFSLTALLVAIALVAIGLALVDWTPEKAGAYQHTGLIMLGLANTVSMVEPNSPAAKAGIRRGDQILTVDGVEVTNISNLWYVFGNRYVGEVVNVEVLRGDKKIILKMSVEVNYALKKIGEGR